MSVNYQSGVAAGRSPEPQWKYISHCVRAIFKKIYQVRCAGSIPNAKACDRAWGFLQGVKMEDEFLGERFEITTMLLVIPFFHVCLDKNVGFLGTFRSE